MIVHKNKSIGIVIILLVVATILGCSHNSQKITYKYYPNGRIKEKHIAKHNSLNDTLDYIYFDNGKLKMKCILRGGFVTDTAYIYDDNGALEQIVMYDSSK